MMAELNCREGSVKSAGFISTTINADGGIEVELWGESRSLKVQSDARHTKAARRALGLSAT
jgi:hypothetical protein